MVSRRNSRGPKASLQRVGATARRRRIEATNQVHLRPDLHLPMRLLTFIAISNIDITDCNDAGPEASSAASSRGGAPRARPRAHPVRARPRHPPELGETISQSYLSLIEKGTRRHLSQESRQLLARSSRSIPGISSATRRDITPSSRPTWRRSRPRSIDGCRTARPGSRTIPRSAPRSIASAMHAESRRCLVLLGEMISMPGLIDRLSQTLVPEEQK